MSSSYSPLVVEPRLLSRPSHQGSRFHFNLPINEIFTRNRLEKYSDLSDRTKTRLQDVPWIRESVQPHDRNHDVLREAGSWTVGEGRYTDSPQQSIRNRDDTDDISLELEPFDTSDPDAIPVPEFTLRITDVDESPAKPIEEVLGEVREVCNTVKDEIRHRRSATAPPAVGDLTPRNVARIQQSKSHSISQYLEAPSERSHIVPTPLPPSSTVTEPALGATAVKPQATSNVSHEQGIRPAAHHLKSDLHHHKPRRSDSQKYEIQFLPTEMADEDNWRSLRDRLPHTIRDHCVFKEGYWWYDGELGALSGLRKSSHRSAASIAKDTIVRLAAGQYLQRGSAGLETADITLRPYSGLFESGEAVAMTKQKPLRPIIEKGSITIAGRPLLIEQCFTHRKEHASWTCLPNLNMMVDTPIPDSRGGEPVVVPCRPIAVPPNLVWSDADPLENKKVNPRKVSEDDLREIAKAVWPREFCLFLDGTLQIMVTKSQIQRIRAFPRIIAGLRVCFSDAVAVTSHKPLVKPHISKLAEESLRGVVKRSRGLHKSMGKKKATSVLSAEHPTSSRSTTSSTSANPSSVRQQASISTNTSAASSSSSSAIPASTPTKQPGPTQPIQAPAVTPSNTPVGPSTPAQPTVAVTPAPTAAPVPHVPCMVQIGADLETAVPCYAGVKVFDEANRTLHITVPTSVALEAAVSARNKARKLSNPMTFFKRERTVSVLDLNVWTKPEPSNPPKEPKKLGIITHCFDGKQDGNLNIDYVHTDGVHPDDLTFDICLVTPVDDTSFLDITSPAPAWWTTLTNRFPMQIVEDTHLEICTPMGVRRHPGRAVSGTDLENFAVFQGYRVSQPKAWVKKKNGSKQEIPNVVLATSTIYRFLGVTSSWHESRGAAVVQVDKTTRERQAVVGLHSFEYLGPLTGNSEEEMAWDGIRRGLLAGNVSIWGSRHLPQNLVKMTLQQT